MSNTITRRGVLRRGGALLGAAALSGSVPLKGFAQSSIRIRFAGYVESQEQLAQTIAVLKAYTAKNPSLEIVPEFTDFGSFTDKIATETAGGNAPDMFSVNVDLMAEYARRGVSTPLDEYVPNPIDLSDYLTSAVKGDSLDGKLYAIPNDAVAPTIIYNTKSFESAKIAVPDQMWTWEQLAETSAALGKALGPRFWGIEDGGGNYIPCDIFLRGRGKSLFTPEHKFGFQTEDLEAWFQLWHDLRDSGGTPPGDIQALAADDPSTLGIVTGRAAMNMNLTDSFVGVQQLMPDSVALHMLPNGFKGGELKQHHYSYAGNATSVWAKSKYKKEIIDIINFMHTDPEGSKIYYRGSGMIPTSKKARDALASEGSAADRAVIEYLDLLQQNPAAPRYPGVTGMSGMLSRANQGVAFAKLKPREAAEQFMREASARL